MSYAFAWLLTCIATVPLAAAEMLTCAAAIPPLSKVRPTLPVHANVQGASSPVVSERRSAGTGPTSTCSLGSPGQVRASGLIGVRAGADWVLQIHDERDDSRVGLLCGRFRGRARWVVGAARK
jgi:hypothetical protein